MHSKLFKSLVFSFVLLFSTGNAFAESAASEIGKGVAKALLFIPGMLLEEYLASLFDEDGRVDRSAETVFIPYLDAKGLHPDYQRYIIQTFAQYVKEVDRYTLKAADKESPYVRSASVPVILNIAKRKDCPYTLFITVREAGSGMRFAFAMKDTQTEELVWHDEYMAIIPEDIAPILFRVANSMGTGKKGSNPKSFYDSEYPVYVRESNFQPVAATHESQGHSGSCEYANLPSNFESRPDTASWRTTRVAFAFGADLLFKGPKGLGNIAIGAWHDFTYVMVGANLDMKGMTTNDASIVTLGLSLTVPVFFHGQNTPYVTGGAAFSSTTHTEKNYKDEDVDISDQGSTLSLGAGFQFNRYGTWTVRFELGYFKNTYYSQGHKHQGIGLKTVIGY